MPVSYLIDHRADGWHVATRSGDTDVVFPTREAAISWIAQFGAGGVPARDRAEAAPYLPAESEPTAEFADGDASEPVDAEPYLPAEQASGDGPEIDDLSTSGSDPRPGGGGFQA